MQASCCSSVSDWLYFFEAAPNRPRQYRCLGVRGSFNLRYRCRCCFLPRRYQTQSPQRPLLIAGSRHAPEGARKGQSRQRGFRDRLRLRTAFRPLGFVGARAFMIRDATLVSPAAFASCGTADTPLVPSLPANVLTLHQHSAARQLPLAVSLH